jgi:hypothetical protein
MKNLRNSWITRSWKRDVESVARWLVITTSVVRGAGKLTLLRRVLGWDDSLPPPWAVAAQIGSVLREVNEIPGAQLKSALDDVTWNGVDQGKLEVRRLVAPAKDGLGNISSEAWNLCLPLVIYEIWSDRESHGLAVSAWGELSENERAATGVPKTDAARGYVASTIILLPQMRPYFVGVDELVVPGGPEPVEQQHLVAEDTDGSVVLSRVAGPLMPEPWRELPVEEALAYISLRYPERSLAAMNLSSGAGHPDALARYPKQDAHGLSGSDFRITLVGKNQLVDVATVGLIRGLGEVTSPVNRGASGRRERGFRPLLALRTCRPLLRLPMPRLPSL